MSVLALGLVVLAAVVHATWNLLAKRVGAGGAPFVCLSAGVAALLYAPVAAWVLTTHGRPTGLQIWVLLGSGVLHAAYSLLLQRGYAVGDLSVVYPVARGVGPLLAVVGAVVLLGERPSMLALAGALAVVAGVVRLARPPRTPGGGPATPAPGRPTTHGPTRRRKPPPVRVRAGMGTGVRAGVGYGLATAVFIASYTLFDAYAVTAVAIPPLLLAWSGNLVRSAVFAPQALQRRAETAALWRRHRTSVLGVGVLSPVSYLLVLLAFTLAPVSYVAPARELSIVVGAALGAWLLGEGPLRTRLPAAAAVVAGVIALGLG